MTTTTVYAELVKHEVDATTGDVLVYGRATSSDLDSDRQVCDAAWLGKAMPAWFTSGANVREQHGATAAGVGTELTQDGTGWNLKSRVVDTGSRAKVQAGVLKGYSIGIANPRVVKDATAPGGRIVGGDIVEVSLVDRPANPTCTLTLAKAARPGMHPKAGDLDTERMLVKVEELHEQPADGVEQLVADAVAKATAPLLERIEQLTKAPDPAPTTDPAPTGTPPAGGDKSDLAELVKAAVAKAVAPLEERLAKAMAQPAPGGPVLARPGQDLTKAAQREQLLAKAAEYDRLAYELSDPQARAGYLELASKARAAAATS